VTTKNIKNQGFTLVELLIVIVIIAILTVVSLVAYNGLQNQAKTSAAKSTVDSVAKKAELYNTEEGKYPEDIAKLTSADTKKSYYIASTNVSDLGTGTFGSSTPTTTVKYTKCPASGDPTGAKIEYYDYSKNAVETRIVGTGC
jgi:fimbrial protein pilin